jgi:hypothetical protein
VPLNHFPSTRYVCPPCPNCSALMMLSRIDRGARSADIRVLPLQPIRECDHHARGVETLCIRFSIGAKAAAARNWTGSTTKCSIGAIEKFSR